MDRLGGAVRGAIVEINQVARVFSAPFSLLREKDTVELSRSVWRGAL